MTMTMTMTMTWRRYRDLLGAFSDLVGFFAQGRQRDGQGLLAGGFVGADRFVHQGTGGFRRAG